MAKKSKKAPLLGGDRVVASNRQARRDYDIIDTWEAGIVLKGSEVKSLREAKVTLGEAYGLIDNGELWLHSLHITAYSHAAAVFGHEADRKKKLLLHRAELDRIRSRVDQERLTVIPLSLYFKNGRAKVEIALARGRKQHDKRQALVRQAQERDADREMARVRRY